VAVAEAIAATTGLSARIKWPNDVMVGERKVCGVLAEVIAGGSAGGLAVVGIGVNVNLDPRAAGLPLTATSLSEETGAAVARDALLRAILGRVGARLALDDAALATQVFRAWEALLWRRRQHVRVDQDGTSLQGTVEGLAPSGALRLRLPDGTRQEIVVGEIIW
jgi:BirA family biotin operon repressor/biotin-[acetyl-CoA-carboxylase] ligase